MSDGTFETGRIFNVQWEADYHDRAFDPLYRSEEQAACGSLGAGGEIRAILQISHGMVEYVERFQNFALWLNQYGILVIGNDHLGHGKTAAGDADLGYIGAGKAKRW